MKDYFEFIKETIENEGWQIADQANKIMLEKNEITTEQYSKAAWIIVEARLAQ